MARKKYAVNMTEGSIWKALVLFAIPLLLGNLFQELYNTVDSIVVGNYVGTEALAAIGTTTPVCNTVVKFFNGISVGAGVVISRCFGARDEEKLRKAVANTVAIALAVGVVVSIVAVPLAPTILRLISTPEDVLTPATTYLRVYFMGIAFLFAYNMGSFILRAVGDTKRPLNFLIISSITNIVLDLVFVVWFRMGIAGTAIATVVSEALSCVLVFYVLSTSSEAYRLNWKELRIDPKLFREIFRIGLPAGIQQGLTGLSNTFVQSYINTFQAPVMAGWSCHVKIDQFATLPAQSMGQAATTFVSQNLGAGDLERAKEGTRTAVRMGVGLMLVLSGILYVSAGTMTSLFTKDALVIYYGILFIRLMSPLRFCIALNQIYAGSLRGAGDAKGPMAIMLFSLVLCRQIYLFTITRFFNNVYTVAFGYPVGWMVCAILLIIYYRKSGWETKFTKKFG